MAKEVIAKCGYRCDLCLAYPANVKRQDRRAELSDGWFKCFGFRIPGDQIVCDGCLAEGGKQVDSGCPVRACAVARGVANCSECDSYPCDTFGKRQVTWEELSKGKSITAEERELFVRPYENKATLDELRRKRGLA